MGGELAVSLSRVSAGRVSPMEFARGIAHIFALYLPPTVLTGALVGICLGALRSAPFTLGARRRFRNMRRLGAADPEGFASGASFLAGLLLFAVVTAVAAEHFATRYHDQRLAAMTMAVTTVGLLAAGAVVTAILRRMLLPVARRLGRLASVATLLALLLLGIAATIALLLSLAPHLLYALDWIAVAWGPGIAIAWLLVAILVRAQLMRRGVSHARIRLMATSGFVAAAVALVVSGSTYGHSNRVRTVVEQRSVGGKRLLRFFADLTDRDRDGHAFAFGGGDCDDGDPSVYPGAADPPGDGKDADCFDGDGSRDVADWGDGHYGERPRGLNRPNFLVITVDALRPDHLGCAGYERATSPNIDRFCAQAVRFEEAIAQSSRSIRSIPAMFTGTYPSQIAFGDEYLFPSLGQENVTLAETLQQRGYATAVTMGTDYFARTGAFFQGFDRINQVPIYKPPRGRPTSEALTQLRQLTNQPEPWLLWVHLFNVHAQYLWDGVPSEFGEEEIDKYDTEILFADREVERILDALAETEDAAETVVVVASDHGEAFGEHQNRGHSFTLYDEELRATLLIRAPHVEPRVVRDRVGLMDLMPTLLNLADIPLTRSVPARSLLPLMRGTGRLPINRLLFAEIMPDGLYPFDQKAIYRGDKKLMWWVRDGTFQLFDLAADPAEREDLSDDRRDEADEMLGLLRAWTAQTNRPENRHRDVVQRNLLSRPPEAMTRRLDARVPGLFTVLGFDLPRTAFAPGERIPMTFYYRVDGETTKDVFFYVDITGPPGYRVPPHFHAHHFPLNGRYRTSEWREGDIIRDRVEMIVPADIPRPARLQITLQMLDGQRRLPVEGVLGSMIELVDIDIR